MGALNLAVTNNKAKLWPWVALAAAVVCWFVAGLAVSRLLYEGLFPSAAWVGRPVGALALGGAAAVAGLFAARYVAAMARPTGIWWPSAVFAPLLLNLFWLLDPAVEPERGRFLFAASLWLAAVLLAWAAVEAGDRRWWWLGPALAAAGLLAVYLATMSHAVGAADTFEFQVVAPQLGIAHPTGYPLYLLLGKLFTLLPFGSVAWRVNLASAVYAAAAAAVVFRLGYRLLRRPLAALAGAVALGLVPVYWSQAIIAEVYSLHALIVAGALMLMLRLIDGGKRAAASDRKAMVALAFMLGLGLTNHLTTVFLLPGAALAIAFNLAPTLFSGRTGGDERAPQVSRRRSLALLALQLLIAFLVPLALYAYLPLRWAAVNHEPMGLGRFIDWVAGGRFQDALQWSAWLRDPTRGEIVARLIFDAWGWFYLALAAVGLLWLAARRWRAALVLLVTAAGFTFYALNYYVPDLAVFLIPTHVVVAVWVAVGLAALLEALDARLRRREVVGPLSALAFVLVLLPGLLAAGGRRTTIDQSGRDGGETWVRGVLAQPLARGAAVLADSEKIAPLYYLQQIERLRPDLAIMVLPDEAAYRTELENRLAAGQTVYLARYLPGLAGSHYLRSAGPLLEVGREPLTELPPGAAESDLIAGPLRLLGHDVESVAAVDPHAAAVTLYWTLDRPLDAGEAPPVLYLRWSGAAEPAVVGLHPANDSYPVNAWRQGEVVADFHLLPLPEATCPDEGGCLRDIEVAVAPRFTPAAELAWQPVATVRVSPRPGPVGAARRAYFDGFALDGLAFPATARPDAWLTARYSGHIAGEALEFLLVPPRALDSLVIPSDAPDTRRAWGESIISSAAVDAATEAGPHVLVAYATGELDAICGWLARPTTGCVVAEIDISGRPLTEGALNFADKIALREIEVEEAALRPGGQLPLTVIWEALAEMNEDYTVFVQVLDAADRIVGQVDAWPVQGTRPTSGWRPGEVIRDPYVVQLDGDMPPGEYRLLVGFYLLASGQRLPVVDGAGNPIDDKAQRIMRLE